MTYEQLAEEIARMTPEQKQCNVTVFIPGIDECYPIDIVSYSTSECDVLDPNHPILNIANSDEDPDFWDDPDFGDYENGQQIS